MPDPPRPRTAKLLLRAAATSAVYFGVLFGAAGRLDWGRGWLFAALHIAAMAGAAAVLLRVNPDLLEARSKWRRPDTKPFDRFFMALFLPLTLIQLALAGLDAVRFHWSALPAWLMFPGIAAFVAASIWITWTLAVNRHAETTVRIQTDRGHTVVTSGPYRFVRHPMYVGLILSYLAAPLILGSLWSLAAGGAVVALVVWRTAMEDRMLRRELPGYEAYASRTQFRLLPGVW